MRKRGLHIFCLCFAIGFTVCKPPKSTYSSRENLYKKNNRDLNTKLLAYHISDSVSRLYFTFSNENILYKRPDTSGWFYCNVKVRYLLHSARETQQLTDSGSVMLFDRQTENVNSRFLSGSLFMKCAPKQDYVCDVFIYDMNKKLKSSYVINIDKSGSNSRQNFLIRSKNGVIVYDYHLHPGDTILISSERNKEINFTADHFNREFPLPPPPYSTVERTAFKYKPDSSFVISRRNGVLKLAVPPKGFYHIITEKETKDGITIFSVDPSFPGLRDELDMIKSIRYITTFDEYNKLLNAEDKKKAIDDFWKEIGGSNERAKELLKKYYGRVYEANRIFTSFQPGWQTDRGMIYIVFGPPVSMYKFSNSESWVYGNEAQPNTLRFNFAKVINPFSDNDFVLDRSEFLKEPWHIAVRGWKEGHIIMDN